MTFKIPIKNRYIVSALLGSAAFALVLIVSLLFHRYFDEWEAKTLDYRFRMRKSLPRSPAITTIGIEQSSLENVGPWPWDRSFHARMVNLLTSFNVRLINFDIFFPASSSEAGDAQFAEAVQHAGNVILGAAFVLVDHPCFTLREYEQFSQRFPHAEAIISSLKTQKGETVCIDFNALTDQQWNDLGQDAGLELLYHSEFAFTGEHDREKLDTLLQHFQYPFAVEQPEKLWYANRALMSLKELLQGALGVGHVTSTPDSDGVLRRIPLVIRVKDQLVPHMTLVAVMQYLQVKPEDVSIVPGKYILLRNARYPDTPHTTTEIKIPVDDRLRLRVNYPPAWEAHAFIDVLSSEDDPETAAFWKEELQDRICTIGYIATGTGDMGPTPYETKFPYALLHAAIMNTILTQRFLYDVGDGINLLIALALVLGISGIAPRVSPLRFTLVIFSTIVVYVAVTILLFNLFGVILKLLNPVIAVLMAYTLITVYWYATEERERKQLRSAFKTYVSRQMLEQIIDNPESLALTGERKEITIMFSDVRKFSTLSDKIQPEVIHKLLNLYFSRMTEIAFKYDGFVDKFIGDGLLCFFGDPLPHPDHALRAVRAAIDMQRAVRELGPLLTAVLDLEPIVIRIGINTGYVIVGNMGSAERMEYTVLGSEVNLAQRLESSATPGQIMISDNTYSQVKQDVSVRDMGEIQVKGFERYVKVYEIELPFE